MNKDTVRIIGIALAFVIALMIGRRVGYNLEMAKQAHQATPIPACFELPACMVR